MELPRVAGWKKEFAGRVLLQGLIRLLSVAVAALAVALWADAIFSLPQFERWLLFAAWWGALAAGVYAWTVRPWLNFEWKEILDAAAREFPQLNDYLKPAWELSRSDSDRHTSQRLKQAHCDRTEAMIRALPRRPLFPWRPDSATRRGAILALLAALTFPALKGSPSWERVAAPWRDMPLEKFIRLIPGDATQDWGKTATISAEWSDSSAITRDRKELKLWIKGPGGWGAVRWDDNAGHSASFTVNELTAPLAYYASWRDLRSRGYLLTPVALPQLESISANISGPNPVSIPLNSAAPLSVRSGCWVAFRGRPNQPLASAAARFAFSASPPLTIPMKLLPSGEYEAGLMLREDGGLRFELETQDGRRDPNPVNYALKALADQPPVVELLSPVIPLQASPADTIPITYSARDDAGLSRISLILSFRGAQREVTLQRFSDRLEFLGDYPLELTNLGPGKIEFWLKAYDNAAAAQSAVSQKGSIEIVDFESGHAAMENLWRKTEENLKALAEKEERSRALSAAQKSKELEAEQAGLPQAWQESVGLLSELSEAMERDVYANPGLSQQSRLLASELDGARKGELSAALKSARAGDLKKAEKIHAGLSNQLKKAARLLAEGRKVQDLQDFHTQAGRMGQKGDSLESALDSMANNPSGKTPSNESVEKLSAALSTLQKQMDSLQKAIAALPQVDPQSAEAKSRRTYSVPLESARQSADALSRALAKGDFEQAARLARQLSRELSEIQKALGQAAAGEEASGLAREAAERMEKAQALWGEVLEEQTKALEKTQKLEERKVGRKLESQKNLLAELSRLQGVLVDSATSRGNWFPADALQEMKGVKAEFDGRRVRDADKRLKAISSELRAMAAGNLASARAYEWFASGEDKIREKLEQGPASPSEGPDEESSAAAKGQAEIRQKTGRLQGALESIEADVAALPGGVISKVEGAQGEQASAEEALKSGDSGSAGRHQENALSLLNQGSKEMNQLAGGQKSIESGMGRPFGRRATGIRTMGGGVRGAQIGFVELPSAKDYLPPKELRQELEKSLQENRPGSYDKMIKEYFKRIAQ